MRTTKSSTTTRATTKSDPTTSEAHGEAPDTARRGRVNPGDELAAMRAKLHAPTSSTSKATSPDEHAREVAELLLIGPETEPRRVEPSPKPGAARKVLQDVDEAAAERVGIPWSDTLAPDGRTTGPAVVVSALGALGEGNPVRNLTALSALISELAYLALEGEQAIDASPVIHQASFVAYVLAEAANELAELHDRARDELLVGLLEGRA